jgi:ABC-type multidrug transport system ATPase subunit
MILDEPFIRLRDVHKSFGNVEVLKGISVDIAKGEVACVIGPSGSGKSTLLRCINALIPITSGSIRVKGIEINDPLNKRTEKDGWNGFPTIQSISPQDGVTKHYDGSHPSVGSKERRGVGAGL